MFTNHNGTFFPADDPLLHAGNRAFRYGWGLFETMLVQDVAIRLAPYHWDRLLEGAALLGLHLPKLMDAAYFEKEVLRTVKKNGLEYLARIRLQLYNGHGGLLDKEVQRPGFVIECFPLEEHIIRINEAGLTIGIAQKVRKAADSLAALKTTSALIYAVATEEAKAARWNDALLLNTQEKVIESTIANLFWIEDGIAYTPPLTDGCVAGTMRRYLLTRLPELGLKVHERTITAAALENVENIFLSNAIRGIRWVGSFQNQSFKMGILKDLGGRLFAT